jgi:hypothetical protein
VIPPLFDKLSQLWRRLLFYLRRDQFDRELEEEMRFHLEMKAEENLAAGTSLEEARCAAQRQFGNQTLLREVSRDISSVVVMSSLFFIGADRADPTPGKDERQDLSSNIFFFHEGSLLGHG